MAGTLLIEEIEGAERWSVRLGGKALPMMATPLEFGVEPRGEITKLRGLAENHAEPLGLDFPPLQFGGRWTRMHLLTRDAAIGTSWAGPMVVPVEIAIQMEKFAARSKTCRVTWSGGFSRIATWVSGSFKAKPWRGSDIEWSIHMPVLALGESPEPDLPAALTPRQALSSQRTNAAALDQLLTGYPPGLAPTFVDRVLEAFGDARQALARVRTGLALVTDFARAPAQVLGALTTTIQTALNLLNDTKDAFDGVALEYRVQVSRSEDLLKAADWRNKVTASTNAMTDDLLALLAVTDAASKPVRRFVAVSVGESLARVAQRVYGPGSADLWPLLASANGIVGQQVPAGVGQLLVPEV